MEIEFLKKEEFSLSKLCLDAASNAIIKVLTASVL
jgi:hypothetical protein